MHDLLTLFFKKTWKKLPKDFVFIYFFKKNNKKISPRVPSKSLIILQKRGFFAELTFRPLSPGHNFSPRLPNIGRFERKKKYTYFWSRFLDFIPYKVRISGFLTKNRHILVFFSNMPKNGAMIPKSEPYMV